MCHTPLVVGVGEQGLQILLHFGAKYEEILPFSPISPHFPPFPPISPHFPPFFLYYITDWMTLPPPPRDEPKSAFLELSRAGFPHFSSNKEICTLTPIFPHFSYVAHFSR